MSRSLCNRLQKQESIPVGCVPPSFVVRGRGVGRVYPQRGLGPEISYLPQKEHGTRDTLPPESTLHISTYFQEGTWEVGYTPRRNMEPEIPYPHRKYMGPGTMKGPDTRDTLSPLPWIHTLVKALPSRNFAGGR